MNVVSMKERMNNLRSVKENRTRNNYETNSNTFMSNQIVRYHTSDGS